MKIATYRSALNRDFIKYEDFLTKMCVQQSDSNITDNDGHEFLEPMADYIAHAIINDF